MAKQQKGGCTFELVDCDERDASVFLLGASSALRKAKWAGQMRWTLFLQGLKKDDPHGFVKALPPPNEGPVDRGAKGAPRLRISQNASTWQSFAVDRVSGGSRNVFTITTAHGMVWKRAAADNTADSDSIVAPGPTDYNKGVREQALEITFTAITEPVPTGEGVVLAPPPKKRKKRKESEKRDGCAGASEQKKHALKRRKKNGGYNIHQSQASKQWSKMTVLHCTAPARKDLSLCTD